MIVASIGRYHFFEQARALAAEGALSGVICDDPRVRGLRGGVAPARVEWLAALGAARLAAGRLRLPAGHRLVRACGAGLARALRRWPEGGVVKINSGFARETLAERPVVVDHGSLHEETVRRRLEQEAAYLGDPRLAGAGNHAQGWLREREQAEFEAAERVVVLSELARRTIVESGVDREKIAVAEPGVDLELFQAHAAPEGARPFRILHAGAVSLNKGVHRLVDAFRHLPRGMGELWIAGRPLAGAAGEAYRARLEQKAAGSAVRFLPPAAQAQLPHLFARADVFVLASLAEGFGLTPLQALACGVPVVVTDECGCAESLRGVPGVRVVAAGDTAALEGALLAAWLEREEGREQARAARAALEREYSWRAHARRLQQALAPALAGTEMPG
jgi:glycosyltransferase involved in cell wall biosynthesis